MPLTGRIPSSPIYQPTLDRISVFVAGNDGHLYDKYWNVSEWVWEDQGTPVHGGVGMPSAVYQPTLDRISVFVIGENNGHLYDKYWDGSKWVWEDQGDPPGIINLSPGNDTLFYPSAIYQPTLDRISVFVAGNCGRMCLYDKYWDGSKWVWEDQGTPY